MDKHQPDTEKASQVCNALTACAWLALLPCACTRRIMTGITDTGIVLSATQVIKDAMDRKFGPIGAWHVITGQSFAYDVTHEVWHGISRKQSLPVFRWNGCYTTQACVPPTGEV